MRTFHAGGILTRSMLAVSTQCSNMVLERQRSPPPMHQCIAALGKNASNQRHNGTGFRVLFDHIGPQPEHASCSAGSLTHLQRAISLAMFPSFDTAGCYSKMQYARLLVPTECVCIIGNTWPHKPNRQIDELRLGLEEMMFPFRQNFSLWDWGPKPNLTR